MSDITLIVNGSAGAAGTNRVPLGDNPSIRAEIAWRVRRGRQNHARAAKLLQLRHRILRDRIDVMMRAQLPRQRLFVVVPG